MNGEKREREKKISSFLMVLKMFTRGGYLHCLLSLQVVKSRSFYKVVR